MGFILVNDNTSNFGWDYFTHNRRLLSSEEAVAARESTSMNFVTLPDPYLRLMGEADILGDRGCSLIVLDSLMVMQGLSCAFSLHHKAVIQVWGRNPCLASHHRWLLKLATIVATSVTQHSVQELMWRVFSAKESNRSLVRLASHDSWLDGHCVKVVFDTNIAHLSEPFHNLQVSWGLASKWKYGRSRSRRSTINRCWPLILSCMMKRSRVLLINLMVMSGPRRHLRVLHCHFDVLAERDILKSALFSACIVLVVLNRCWQTLRFLTLWLANKNELF